MPEKTLDNLKSREYSSRTRMITMFFKKGRNQKMPKRRLAMRKIKEILRLHHENGLSIRQIGICCNLSRSTVSDYLAQAKIAQISLWQL